MSEYTEEHYKRDKRILSEADKGATHYVVLQYDFIEAYIKLEGCLAHTINEDGETWGYREDLEFNGFHEVRDLEDIRRSVELYEVKLSRGKALKYFNALAEVWPEIPHSDTRLGEMVSLLKQRDIEQQIKVIEHALESYVTAKFYPTTYAIQAFNDGVNHLHGHICELLKQLRQQLNGGE